MLSTKILEICLVFLVQSHIIPPNAVTKANKAQQCKQDRQFRVTDTLCSNVNRYVILKTFENLVVDLDNPLYLFIDQHKF